jgi:hypothetical protein
MARSRCQCGSVRSTASRPPEQFQAQSARSVRLSGRLSADLDGLLSDRRRSSGRATESRDLPAVLWPVGWKDGTCSTTRRGDSLRAASLPRWSVSNR